MDRGPDRLDRVIAVDTGLAHLSGALGEPTWILLSSVPDFRWPMDRTHSPWYPTATLYRQPNVGDWNGVLARLKADLQRTFVGLN
jgi:ADP-heptose:LPS heptosyltransferase